MNIVADSKLQAFFCPKFLLKTNLPPANFLSAMNDKTLILAWSSGAAELGNDTMSSAGSIKKKWNVFDRSK